MNKNVIYTYLIGNYDNLVDPSIVTPGWDYICFSDNKDLKSDIWKISPLPEHLKNIDDPKRVTSLLKIEYYKIIDSNYNIVISMDASGEIKMDINSFLNNINFNKEDMIVFNHPDRNCSYKEAEVIKQLNLDHHHVVDNQINTYKKNKYPISNGLWVGGIIIRNNKSKKVKKACKIWSEEYRKGSRRDQLSFIYSFWKSNKLGNKIKIKTLDWGEYIIYFPPLHPIFFYYHKKGHDEIRFINKKTNEN